MVHQLLQHGVAALGQGVAQVDASNRQTCSNALASALSPSYGCVVNSAGLSSTYGWIGVIVAAVLVFWMFTLPIVLWANKAIGARYEREAADMKEALDRERLRYSEDGARLRVSAVAPLALGVRWLRCDLRVDDHALYVMQYHLVFGRLRIGQPNLRVTRAEEPRVGGFLAVPIIAEPRLEPDAVVVRVTLRWSALWLRLRTRDPGALYSAIVAMH